MNQQQKEFLKQMYQLLREKYEIRLNENELYFLLSDVGLHQETVRAEMMFYDTESTGQEPPYGMLQLYITLCEYREEEKELLAARLTELNQKTLIGHFGIYPPLHQIYYRYSLPMADVSAPAAQEMTCIVMSQMTDLLDYLYDYIVMIGDNASSITLEEYEAEMKNLAEILEQDPDFLDKLRQEEE